MNEPILIFPHNSVETEVTVHTAIRLRQYMLSKGIHPVELGMQRARRGNLAHALKGLDPHHTGLLIYLGHGGPDNLNGSAFLEAPRLNLVQLGMNEDWLATNLITCTIACDSLTPLGEKIVSEGGRAFMGSSKDMWVNWIDLEQDGTADIIKTFLTLTEALVDGKSVSSAVAEFKAESQYFLVQGTAAGKPGDYIEAMTANMESYDTLGDDSAKWEGVI